MKPPHPTIPPGTKVLTRAGNRVGLVTDTPPAPHLPYQIRFTDGTQAPFLRHQLTIFKHTDAEVPGAPDPAALRPFVIFQ